MSNRLTINAQPHRVKKFYFLEYFYILLKGVQLYSQKGRVFNYFLDLKQKYQLGESKYKKSTLEDSYSEQQIARFRYTFEQVISEAEDYNLISRTEQDSIHLTSKQGANAIAIYEEQGAIQFYKFLLRLMEEKYLAFEYLLDVCYSANPIKHGLLIFPVYSPLRLGFERSAITTSADFISYFNSLKDHLRKDVTKYLGKNISLEEENDALIRELMKANLLPDNRTKPFEPSRYKAIVKRGRDFWLDYFLRHLYGYHFSLNSFDIWAYRGEQIGVLHITEFYPDPEFSGRIVYPLAVLLENSRSKDFEKLFSYQDGRRLYLHQPSWENNQNEFITCLVDAYFDLRKSARSYFINLWNVREIVCYKMKIPGYLFDRFLSEAYRLSFGGDLAIRISLEVDRLPGVETNAMYLKRPPLMIGNKFRNIIGIDLTRRQQP